MKKFNVFMLLSFLYLVCYGQTSYKQVYDKALEYQIRSSVGVSGKDFWQFHPGWYYSMFHSRYKSGNYEKNNYIQLDSIVSSSAQSALKTLAAKEDIEVIYQHELAHWNDRNNDWELELLKKQLSNVRDALYDIMGAFGAYKVSVDHALKMYNELDRIDNKVTTLGKAHLDNSKRRQGYEKCQQEYIELMNVCYKLCNYSLVASKYDDFDLNRLNAN
jgi:hypothetical protein